MKHYYPAEQCGDRHCACYNGHVDGPRAHAHINGEQNRCCFCGTRRPIPRNTGGTMQRRDTTPEERAAYQIARRAVISKLTALADTGAVIPLDKVVALLPVNPEWATYAPRPRGRPR